MLARLQARKTYETCDSPVAECFRGHFLSPVSDLSHLGRPFEGQRKNLVAGLANLDPYRDMNIQRLSQPLRSLHWS